MKYLDMSFILWDIMKAFNLLSELSVFLIF